VVADSETNGGENYCENPKSRKGERRAVSPKECGVNMLGKTHLYYRDGTQDNRRAPNKKGREGKPLRNKNENDKRVFFERIRPEGEAAP